MAWYRCECGFITQVTPRRGNVIASVNHLHRSARVDGTSAIVRMEESRTPITGEMAGGSEAPEQRIAA
jgi:hypothetical protein